jgi:capsular polysaccharide biosynthesis protein
MMSLRKKMTIILCLKFVLLTGIQQAFFSERDKVIVNKASLNSHLGLPVLAPVSKKGSPNG